MRYKTTCILTLLFFARCSSLSLSGYKSLGGNYFIWEGDHHRYSIIWSEHPESGGSLITGLNETVVKYAYDKNFIIIKTIEFANVGKPIIKFWLIKKIQINFNIKNWRQQVISKPLDSLGLRNTLFENKLNLFLKSID